MLIARASRPSVVALGRDVAGQFVNRARYPQAVETPGVLVIRSAGGWFYFNADFIRRRILELTDAAPTGLKAVVLDLSIVPTIDTTAGTMLRTLARSLRSRGVSLKLAELRDDVLADLKAIGAEQDLGAIEAHCTIMTSLDRVAEGEAYAP